MPRPAFLSTTAPIVIGDESLDDGAALPFFGPVAYGRGLEMVPGWQARSSRPCRRLLPGLAVLAVSAVAGLWTGRGDNAGALHARPVTAAASEPGPEQAIVAGAAATRDADAARAAR